MRQSLEALRRLEKAFQRVIEDARDQVVLALTARALVAAGDDGPPGHVPQPDTLFDADAWDAAVRAEVGPVLEDMVVDSANRTVTGYAFDVDDPRMILRVQQHVDAVGSWGTELRANVAATVERGMADGWSVQRMADELTASGVLSDKQALNIARTEAISASNGGTYEAWQVAGIGSKVWASTYDQRTRPSHRMADGQQVDLLQPFIVGGFHAQYPGDPELPAQERINCRCTMHASDEAGPAGLDRDALIARLGDRDDPLDEIVAAWDLNLPGGYTSAHRTSQRTGTSLRRQKRDRGPSAQLDGVIRDADGQRVGAWYRSVNYDQDTDTVWVGHESLVLSEEVQGQGIASAFNAQAEDFYRAVGVDEIRLEANIDVGGYAWARAGYDWDIHLPDDWADLHPDTRREWLADEMETARAILLDAEDAFRLRGDLDDYLVDLEDLANRLDDAVDLDDLPTPFELSRLGYRPGDTTWPGKEAMLGKSWNGVRRLDGPSPRAAAQAAERVDLPDVATQLSGRVATQEEIDRIRDTERRLRALRAQRRDLEDDLRFDPTGGVDDPADLAGLHETIELSRGTEARLTRELDELRAGLAPLEHDHGGVYRLLDELEDHDDVDANRALFAAAGDDGDALIRLVDGWTSTKHESQLVRDAVANHEAWADRAIEILDHAPTNPVDLYRGMHWTDQDMVDAFMGLGEGDVIPGNAVTSWTAARSWADRFLGPDQDGVRLVLQGGDGRALPVQHISNSPAEQEWLTTGNYRVVEIDKETINVEDEYETYLVTVYVEAV